MGKLQEELNRFNAINKYTEKLLNEQEPPMPPPPGGAAPTEDPAAAAPTDPNALPPPEGADTAAPPPAAGDEATPPTEAGDEVASDTGADDTTEELDITDLVNMTKSIKKQLDDTQNQPDDGAAQKMDDVFSKLGELEAKLGEMDQVLAKIDQLGAQIEQSKPKTPIEKLEMRSLDSYPFNKKPDEFFADKKGEMEKTGKNEYVLTKDDVENYGRNEIMKSFNPKASDNPYNYNY